MTTVNNQTITPSLRITSADRMSFTIVMACLVHALILFGINFVITDKKNPDTASKQMEIVLAIEHSDERPDKADFVGQANQDGGSEQEILQRSTTKHLSEIPSLENNPTLSSTPSILTPDDFSQSTELTSQTGPESALSEQSKINNHVTMPAPVNEQSNENGKNASLMVDLGEDVEAQSKHPKKRTISQAIHQASDAAYLEQWRQKVERIGNNNYPAIAIQKKLYGTVKLGVIINQDGTLNDIQIRQRSDYKILDDAAIRIVKLSAPFAPLTEEMSKNTEVLEIIKVWKFEPNN